MLVIFKFRVGPTRRLRYCTWRVINNFDVPFLRISSAYSVTSPPLPPRRSYGSRVNEFLAPKQLLTRFKNAEKNQVGPTHRFNRTSWCNAVTNYRRHDASTDRTAPYALWTLYQRVQGYRQHRHRCCLFSFMYFSLPTALHPRPCLGEKCIRRRAQFPSHWPPRDWDISPLFSCLHTCYISSSQVCFILLNKDYSSSNLEIDECIFVWMNEYWSWLFDGVGFWEKWWRRIGTRNRKWESRSQFESDSKTLSLRGS